jgi:hypothetical protein
MNLGQIYPDYWFQLFMVANHGNRAPLACNLNQAVTSFASLVDQAPTLFTGRMKMIQDPVDMKHYHQHLLYDRRCVQK